MPRMTAGIESTEGCAAAAFEELAEKIQEHLYYSYDVEDTPLGTIRELNRCYRVLKPLVTWYRGNGEHHLIYEASATKFDSKEKKLQPPLRPSS